MRWLFDVGASFYAWLTAQDAWRGSCASLVDHLPPGAGLRIVDLGCGPGTAALETVRRRPRDWVVGVDNAWGMLRQAHRRSRAGGRLASRVHWICADARALPFRAGSIDALTGHSVLYLVADREAALAECLRVLRSGGRLVVMEPNDRSVRLREVWRISRSPRFLLSMALWRPVSGLRGRFGQWSLVATLRGAGFADCHVQETLGGLGLYARAQKA